MATQTVERSKRTWKPMWKTPPERKRTGRTVSTETLHKVELLEANPREWLVWGSYASPSSLQVLKEMAKKHEWPIEFVSRKSDEEEGRYDIYASWHKGRKRS